MSEFSRRDLLRVAGVGGAGLFVPAVGTTASAVPSNNYGYRTTDGATEPTYGKGAPEEHYVETAYTLPPAMGGESESPSLFGEVVWPTADGEIVTDVPLVLTLSPYNDVRSPQSEVASIANDAVADYFVPRGYARAVFDVVGCRNSSGCYDYGGFRERVTGAQLVEYLGGEPDAGGAHVNDRHDGPERTRRVGMIGGSYDGTTQLAAAVEDPAHLACVIPQVAIDRWYDYAYGGAIRYFLNNQYPTDEGFDTPLAFDFGFGFVPPANVDDPQRFRDAMDERFAPCERLQHTERAYATDPVYDEFWLRRDYREKADGYEPSGGARNLAGDDDAGTVGGVSAAVFIEGGWLDHNVKHWDSTRFFQALPDDVPKKLVMGQWNHAASQFADAQDVRHAWFDRWLQGIDTDVMALPRVDTQLNTGERVQEGDWPPAGTTRETWTLGRTVEGSDLALRGTNLALYADGEPPLTEEEMFARDGSAEDHLEFLSAPVESPTRVAGSPLLRLAASSTMDSVHVTPVLFDEAPDGSREVITRGFRNARFRGQVSMVGLEPEPVPTDGAYEVPVEFWDVDWLVRAGHRVGLVVASDNRDWALGDPDGHAVTELLLDRTELELPVGPATLDVSGTRSHSSEAYTAGRTARIEVTAEANKPFLLRDALPADWNVRESYGDVARVEREGGRQYVYFQGDAAASRSAVYYAEAPASADASGPATFGPLAATTTGNTGWTPVPGTSEDTVVVAADLSGQ